MDERYQPYLETEKPSRLSEYKTRSVICDQEKRRLQLLQDQKRRRDERLNALRNTTDLFFEDDPEEEEHEVECMEWVEEKPKQTRLKDMFMLSEWMTNLPVDFEEKWLFLLCPVGRRCLVHCARGYTTAYGKRGQRLARFQSPLPNGSQRDYTGTRYSNSEVTILDCIWCSQTKSYYILDVLSWKGQLYMDTETSFRAFWIKSKLEEMPWLEERSERNPFPFKPLNYHPCDIATISTTISEHPLEGPQIDGILFYHSEAYYTPGSTPLVVWLKPYMLPEVMNLTIPEVYMEARPPSYIDKDHFIKTYEEKQKRKNKRGKDGRRRREDVEGVTTEVEMLEEE